MSGWRAGRRPDPQPLGRRLATRIGDSAAVVGFALRPRLPRPPSPAAIAARIGESASQPWARVLICAGLLELAALIARL